MQTHQPSERELEPQTATAMTEEPLTERGNLAEITTVSTEATNVVGGDAETTEIISDPAAVATENGAHPDPVPVETASDGPAVDADELAERASDRGSALADEPASAVTAEQTGDQTPPATVALNETVPEPAVETNASDSAATATDSTPEVAAEAPVESVTAPPEAGTEEASQPNTGAMERLIAEVAAAPHKVYLLGKVRKAIEAAGESELATRLRETESDVLAQVASRTEAKEALCARAEALKDSTAWKVTGDAFKALFDEWKQVGAAGRELDDQLWARFNLARGAFNEHRAKHFEEREQVWSANREQKETLCAEAEALADSLDWKTTAEKIRDLQARWKAVGSAGREKDEALWARFNSAKQRFFDHRAAAWNENRQRKEALVVDAEALKESTDWRTTGDALKAMQAEWKTIGPAGREHEDELWSRFRAATQVFFDHRGNVFAERNKSERDNLAKKQEICERAEALVYTAESLAAAREAKELQALWKETGPVPREQSEALWARFRGACDKIFENAHGERDRQQNEWHSRMRDAMTRKREQLTSLRESIEHDEANIGRWRDSLSTLKPGGKSDEIGRGLEDKIIDVMNRIREKQGRVEELRSSINDIEAKLKE